MLYDSAVNSYRPLLPTLRSDLDRILLVASALAILLAATGSMAQEPSRWDLFGGFSYADANLGSQNTVFAQRTSNFYGIHLTGTYSPKPYMRFRLIDFSVQMGPTKAAVDPGLTADIRTSQVLFGPEFLVRSRRANLFANTLVGLTNTRLVERIGGSDIVPDVARRTNLAFGVGGGVDVPLRSRWGCRAFELDYIPTRLDGAWTNHVRVSTGIVYSFGPSTPQ